MAAKWQKASYPGVRFREHPTRKHGVKKDRYFIISYRLEGKRKDEALGWSSKGWTEKKANKLLAELQENQRNGSGPQTLAEKREIENERREAEQQKIEQEAIDNKTFAEFFKDDYLPTTSHKKQYTVKNEIGLFTNWIEPAIGHLPFNQIKSTNLVELQAKMKDSGRSSRSSQYCFAVFRQVWNQARKMDLVNEDCPTSKIKLCKVENKRTRFLSHEEAEILLKTLREKSQQVYDMALLSLHTGMRAGELYSLTWGVVDLKNGSALIRGAKGADRHVYFTRAVKQIFERLYQGQPASEFVFKDRSGKKIRFMSKTFDRTVKELGLNKGVKNKLDKVLFHTLRHTFASWHVQNGTDLYTVKKLLGHSTIQLTERYSHLRPEGLKQTAKDFDKIVKQNRLSA